MKEKKEKKEKKEDREKNPDLHTEIESLWVNGVDYPTKLTKKYGLRKPYSPLDPGLVTAFIPGTITEVFVNEGDEVPEGKTIVVLEAMKMLNQLKAPFHAKVEKVNVIPGARVIKNQVLIELKLINDEISDSIN